MNAAPGLRCDDSLRERLAAMAGGRSIVIDHYASRRCGATIGDLRVGLESWPPQGGDDGMVELEPIGGVRVVAEASLVGLLDEARLRLGRALAGRELWIDLDRPERWLDFLDAHPGPRR
jgi:hypothetical protein